jgi:hypothetical protein
VDGWTVSRRDWPWLVVALLVVAGLKVFTWGREGHENASRLQQLCTKAMVARQYRDSELLAFIRQLPHSRSIYTNDPWLVRYWTDRDVKELPYTAAARDTLGPGMQMSVVATIGGWCVWFRNGNQDYLPPDSFRSIGVRAPNGEVYGTQDSTGMRMMVGKPNTQ